MNNRLDEFENVIEQILEILDDNNISLEDGVAITANLFMMSLHHMGEVNGQDSLESMFELLNIPQSLSNGSVIPHNRIGLGRGWGLDPSLVTEDN